MATVRSSIELQDNFTSVLNSIISAVNVGLSTMDELNRSMNRPVDTASFDAAREAANQATIAIQNMDAAMQNADASTTGTSAASVHISVVPDVPDPLVENPAPVPVPVEWQTDNMEVFTGTGVERFQQEVQSANNMLNTLNTTQERIATTAAQTDLFPPDGYFTAYSGDRKQPPEPWIRRSKRRTGTVAGAVGSGGTGTGSLEQSR